MSRNTGNAIPIPGADNPNRTYLELVPDYKGDRVIIRPGSSGRRLPPFWQVWLREALLELMPPSHVLAIRFDGNWVIVSSSRSLGATLNMAERAARQVYTFPAQPLIRWRRDRGERFQFHWQVNYRKLVQLSRDDEGRPNRLQYRIDLERLHQRVREAMQDMRLPRGCRLSAEFNDLDDVNPDFPRDFYTEVTLHVARSVKFRPAELRKLVEMRFALALFPLDRRSRQAA